MAATKKICQVVSFDFAMRVQYQQSFFFACCVNVFLPDDKCFFDHKVFVNVMNIRQLVYGVNFILYKKIRIYYFKYKQAIQLSKIAFKVKII